MTFLCRALSSARLPPQQGRLSLRDEEETPQTALCLHDATTVTTQMAIMQEIGSSSMFDHFWELKLKELEVLEAEKGHCCVSEKHRKRTAKKRSSSPKISCRSEYGSRGNDSNTKRASFQRRFPRTKASTAFCYNRRRKTCLSTEY